MLKSVSCVSRMRGNSHVRFLGGGGPRNGLLLPDHGQKSPYPHSMDWLDCFCEKEPARVLDSQPLVDVTMLPEEEIIKHGIIYWLEMSQKMVHTGDMMEIAPYLIRLDKLFPLNDELFKSLLYYLFQEGETSDRMLFFDAFSSTTQRENVMTIAEELKREGREEGREEIAKNLLNNGFSFKQVKMYTGLSEDSLNKLLH